jgi:rhodanese-related sulfurtransferase
MQITFENLDWTKHQLIDIREEYERTAYAHPNALHIPMGSLVDEAANLDKEIIFVICCATGTRSLNIVKLLRAKGFNNYLSLDGGNETLQMHNS